MVWVEMHETQLFRSVGFTRLVVKTIFDILKAISEDVLLPVGFVDVRDGWVWEYDSSTAEGDTPWISGFVLIVLLLGLANNYFKFKDSLIPKPMRVLPSRAGQIILQQLLTKATHWLDDLTNGLSIVSNGFMGGSPSGPLTPLSPPPFHGFADIVYHRQSHQISLSTMLSVASSTWYPQQPPIQDHARRVCKISVDRVCARITRQTRTIEAGERREDPLRIALVTVTIEPSLYQNNDQTERSSRLFTTHNQSPSLRDAMITSTTTYTEFGGSVRLTYPGAALEISRTRTNAVSRPATAVGLVINEVQIGIQNQNQFFWRYPISKEDIGGIEVNKSATFSDHVGEISYLASKAPDAVSVKTSMTCVLLHNTRSNNRWNNALRGLLWFVSIVRDNGVDYPCRHVRFKLHTDIPQDENGLFVFPRDGECGTTMDLGEYRFHDNDGVFCLEILRGDDRLNIDNPHQRAAPFEMTSGLWKTTADTMGNFSVTETSAKEINPNVKTALEIGVTEPLRKKQKRSKMKIEDLLN
jgi:hypothetical protein